MTQGFRFRPCVFVFPCALIFAFCISPYALGGKLPAEINFDGDTPNNPPSTGGVGEPSGYGSNLGATLLVQTSTNGIASQPVVGTVDVGQTASIRYDFTPIWNGALRYEATISMSQFAVSIITEASASALVSPSPRIIQWLETGSGGELYAVPSYRLVGNYKPKQPFRYRIDIDMTARKYSIIIDSELNGFDDDPVYGDIPFFQADNTAAPSHIGKVKFVAYTPLEVGNTGVTSVAFDDIYIEQLIPDRSYDGLNIPLIKAAMDKRLQGK
jgi:hypothetical protein